MAYQIMTLRGFINEVKSSSQGPYPRKFCFVLGAGASKTSGIKTGEELVEIWEQELVERNPKDHEKWKKQLGITEKNRGNFYSSYYQRRFEKDDGKRCRDGYNYLEQMMNRARPSGGYVYLSLIMAGTKNKVVITTNFDHLVEDALLLYGHDMPMVIGHEKLAPYAMGTIAHPTVVKIHRDLLLNPINKPDELDKLHLEWVDVLDNLFSQYHPVFIGYAGNDNSVMDFLCENVGKFNSKEWAFPYWLIYGNQQPEGKVAQFLRETDGYLISHGGFDQVMVKLGNALGQRLPSEDEYIQKTREQYKSLTERVDRLLEEDLTEGEGQQPNSMSETLDEASSTIMEEKIDVEDIPDVDEGELYSRYLAAQTGGEYEKALRYIRHLVELHPYNPRYRYGFGVTLHGMGRYGDALQHKKAAVTFEPNNGQYRNSLGVTLHAMKRYEEALIEKQRAVKLEPENALYHRNVGVTLHEMKRYEVAFIEKHKAIELEPDNAEYHNSLGITLHAMKRYEDAVVEKRKAIELQPDDAEYHNSLGITLSEMGRYEEALTEGKKAIELESNNARYHDNLSTTLHEMEQYEDALVEAREAVELEMNNARYHDNLSVTLHAIKRYEEAEAEERKAIELEPTNARYYDNLSTTLHEMRRYEEAAEETRKAIELEPHNPKYYDSLAITLQAMGQEEEAAEMEKKAEKLRAAQENT